MLKATLVSKTSSFDNLYRSGSGDLIEMVGYIPTESQFPLLGIVHKKNGKNCLRTFNSYGISRLGDNPGLNIVSKITSDDLHMAIKLAVR
jgi:hypothetical protein